MPHQQAELTTTDGDSGDGFGSLVDISSDGTTAIVAAPEDEDPNGAESGTAYVYNTTGGSWTQQSKLVSDDGESGDSFGRSVALSADGSTALVGSYNDDIPTGDEVGSVCVFDTKSGSWSQRAKLTPDDGANGDYFGRSVAVSDDGTTAVVGAYRDNTPNGEGSGSTYVFQGENSSWSQQAELTPDDGDQLDQFGWSVAVSRDGTTVLVGAYFHDDPNGGGAGSAYVFSSADGSWRQQENWLRTAEMVTTPLAGQ